jgi:hypothetical protein
MVRTIRSGAVLKGGGRRAGHLQILEQQTSVFALRPADAFLDLLLDRAAELGEPGQCGIRIGHGREHRRARAPGHHRVEVAGVAPHGVPHRLCPGQHRGLCAFLDVAGERADDVEQDLCLRVQLRESAGPCGKRRRRIIQSCRHLLDGVAQLLGRDRLRALGALGLLRRLKHQLQRVADSLQDCRSDERAAHALAARLRQRNQMPGQIAAVDRRHVYGIQRP